MKLMVIKAVENRKEREVYLNPAQVEAIEAHEGVNLVVTSSGRWIYTEMPLADLYTNWMVALNPEMELAFNAGVQAARTAYEAQLAKVQQEAQQETREQEEGAV